MHNNELRIWIVSQNNYLKQSPKMLKIKSTTEQS